MARRRRSTTHKRDQDHFARRAQAEGYQARSVFKLDEMDRRHHLLRPGARVVDLGCAPGSWSRYARERIGASGQLVGVDIQELQHYPGHFLQADLEELDADTLGTLLGGLAQVVLSDMAPNTTGNSSADHLQQIRLAEAALAAAERLLEPGGHFVVKVFDGRDAPALTEAMRARFESVKRERPPAVRKESREFFLVGLGYLGAAQERREPEAD